MKLFGIICSFLLAMVLMNACQKEYSIENGNKGVAQGNWQFSNGTTLYKGNMDTIYQIPAGSTNELFLIGTTTNGTQKFEMHLFADTFKIGTYKASMFQSSFLYSSAGNTIYEASQLISEFVVNVTSLDDNHIEGTFSGTAQDSTDNSVQLTAGSFNSTFASGIINQGSSGVLGDSAGNCKPVIIEGTYAKGIPTNNSNTLQAQVTVAIPGGYTISTNTVNGVSFSRTGTFAVAGPQNVLLYATGTPTSSGNNMFTLSYGNSQCAFSLSVSGDATGTLGSSAGACTSFAFAGTYQQGVIMNAGNSVTVQVNVATPGAYTITSDSTNGVRFSGSGIFSATGIQSVALTAVGTPLNAGLQNYNVTFGTSTCGFGLTFLPAAAASDDYFPLSLKSNWTYELVGGSASDNITNTVIGYAPNFGGQSYQTLEESKSGTPVDSLYFRKPGGNYYQYVDFSTLFGFDQYVGSEFIFLKDNVGVGQTWSTPNFNGTIGGAPVSGHVNMEITDKAVPVTSIPGFNFPDVIKVEYKFFITGVTNPVLTQERWFAKNTGEIYFSSSKGTTNTIYQVSTYQVF
ncbi:MAG TPA: hypothetical protein VIJ75_02560 [Hanamia sp.]